LKRFIMFVKNNQEKYMYSSLDAIIRQ